MNEAKPKAILFKKLDEQVVAYLQEHCELVYLEGLNEQTRPRFEAELPEAEGILGSGLKVDAALLDRAPRLRVVSNFGVGYDNLDTAELKARGIIAANTPEVLNDSVADAVMGLMLAAARRIPELDRYVRAGRWTGSVGEQYYGTDVHHKTVGIIGMGAIGERIAQRARFGFDMEVLYHNRSRKEDAEHRYGARYCSMDELLAESDFVCLMTPLTSETRGMMGRAEFAKIKPGAIFINASRGATVDEEALLHALKSGIIAAAGLDVFEREPIPGDHPLLALDNVVALPHIGSATHETRLNMAWLAARNLVAALEGKEPPAKIRL